MIAETMKKASPFLVLLSLLLFCPVESRAQPDIGGITEIYATGGITQPLSPTRFRDYWQLGNHMTAGVGFGATNAFTLRAGMRYNSFLLDTASLASDLSPETAAEVNSSKRYYLVGTTFDLLLDSPLRNAWAAPYFVIGISVYYTTLGDMEIEKEFDISQTSKVKNLAAGMNVGLGVSRSLTKDLEAFAQYTLIGGFMGGDKKAFSPLSVGLSVKL